MAKAARFLGVTCAALALGAGGAVYGQGTDGEVQESTSVPAPPINLSPNPPPPIRTVPVNPTQHLWSADDFNGAMRDCIAAMGANLTVDRDFLTSAGWRPAFETTIDGPPGVGTIAVEVFARGPLHLSIEVLPRGEMCHAMGRVRDEAQFWQIVGQFPSAIGSELFDEHDGHPSLKQNVVRSLGEEGKPLFQFYDHGFLTLQVLTQDGVTMASSKLAPTPPQ